MNGGRDSRDPVDGERHDAVDAFFRRPEKRDALREVGHRVQEGDQDVPEQNPANCFFLLIWAFTGLFLDLFFPLSWYIVGLQLINFTIVNADRKQERRRSSMLYSFKCY